MGQQRNAIDKGRGADGEGECTRGSARGLLCAPLTPPQGSAAVILVHFVHVRGCVCVAWKSSGEGDGRGEELTSPSFCFLYCVKALRIKTVLATLKVYSKRT
jgi:hypothetical protein